MRKLIFRRRVWMVVLASGFAGACSSQLGTTQTQLPAPCNAAALTDDILSPGLLNPANGTVTGSEVLARLCDGGASAYLERTSPTTSPANQLLMTIGSYTVDPKRDFQIELPTDATRLQLSVLLGPTAAEPGTYTDGDSCGDIILCAIFPAPTSVHCPEIVESDICPPGCTGTPPVGCVPSEPATCYGASTDPNCSGGSPALAKGPWRLTLSSVEPYTGPSFAPGYDLFVTHGSLDATLEKIGATPSSTLSLSLRF